jgi:Zn-dependent metalloprotease
MTCTCSIIPSNVLKRFSRDKKLSASARKRFADAAAHEKQWRELRALNAATSASAQLTLSAGAAIAAAPAVTVFDCANGTTLPGAPVPNPGSASDPTAKRTYVETRAVAKFYKSVFGRNSIDNLGMTLQSSIHYGVRYNNAYWNGAQMTYGDGDSNIFVDFTLARDVIGHELTHGVTQYTAQLAYADEPGGLNESMSDVFGSMFRQWRSNQSVLQADWLIGKEIMGPAALARGYTCLRDMANPAAAHCLAPQPTHYSQYQPGMDPHYSSGIPNLAFYRAAMAIGGKSWIVAGRIWYKALTGFGSSPNLTMKKFAARTRSIAKATKKAAIVTAVNKAWKSVGL